MKTNISCSATSPGAESQCAPHAGMAWEGTGKRRDKEEGRYTVGARSKVHPSKTQQARGHCRGTTRKSQCRTVFGSMSCSKWGVSGAASTSLIPAPLIPMGLCPWLSGLAGSGTAALQRAKPDLSSVWLGHGECCVYQGSEGMLSLQDNGFLGSQKKLNSLPRWKIVPFHPLYN